MSYFHTVYWRGFASVNSPAQPSFLDRLTTITQHAFASLNWRPTIILHNLEEDNRVELSSFHQRWAGFQDQMLTKSPILPTRTIVQTFCLLGGNRTRLLH